MMLVITDGHSDNMISAWHQSYVSRRAGIHMMTIGLPTNTGLELEALRSIASWPSQRNVWALEDFDGLGRIVEEVWRALCNGEWDGADCWTLRLW